MRISRDIVTAVAVVFVGASGAGSHAQPSHDTSSTADDYPDLTGTWENGSGITHVRPLREGNSICIRGCEDATPAPPRLPPERPSYKPEFAARVRDLDARQVEEDPALRCYPPGVPRIGPPDKIVQIPGQLVFLYNDITGSHFRTVPTDGRPHRTDIGPSYLGDAIGHFEDDTLVVETTNFNDNTWLTDDGSFHTMELRVVERLRRDGDTLHYQATAFDPAVLAEPWEMRPRVASLTDRELVPAPPCIEQDIDHIVDGTHHDNVR